MSEWKEFLNEQLQDPELRTEWEALEPEFAIVQAMIDARIHRILHGSLERWKAVQSAR